MTNQLATKINNPLQSLTNLLCEAEQTRGEGDEHSLATKLDGNFRRRPGMLKGLLKLPRRVLLQGGGKPLSMRSGQARVTYLCRLSEVLQPTLRGGTAKDGALIQLGLIKDGQLAPPAHGEVCE